MNYKELRFFGFYLHDIGEHQRALAVAEQELKDRQPDDLAPTGYGPSEVFLKEARRFRSDFRKMQDDLVERAQAGESITRDEKLTLERGERLNALVSESGNIKSKLGLLASGKDAFNSGGLSASALIDKLTDSDNGPKERVTITAEPRIKL